MSTIPFTKILFSAFEQAISSDFTRIGTILNRELAELTGDMSCGDTLGVISGIVGQGGFIPGLSKTPTIFTNGVNLNVTIGAGQGFTAGTPATADEADYNVCRWAQTTLTVVPDGVNPRVDLIVARPATALVGSVSRNILVDPVARTVQIQNIYKQADPAATILFIAGTPGALGSRGSAPLPPAPAAGDLVIAEIFVPTAATISDNCGVIRRTNRLAVGALASYHGLLQGQFTFSSTGDEATADSRPFVGAGFPTRAIIDGELVESQTAVQSADDNLGGQNPFGSAAPAVQDKPYYVYLCGGSIKPQWNGVQSAPLVLVNSTIAPDAFGHPSANIGTPRGSTRLGALYVGVGFVIRNSTRGKLVRWEGDWVHALSGWKSFVGGIIGVVAFNNGITTVATGSGSHPFTTDLGTVPATSTWAKCIVAAQIAATASGGVARSLEVLANRDNGTTGEQVVSTLFPLGEATQVAQQPFEMDPTGGSPLLTCDAIANNYSPGTLATLVMLAATSYNMNVPRLAP